MKWAVIKGKELVRFEEHDAQREIPPGSKRYPVVIQQKPPHDPSTQYLDSYWQLADDHSCVGILYTIHDKPPEPVSAPSAPPVVVERVVERIVEQTSSDQVEALRRAVVEMQAAHAETQTAQRIGDLIGTVMNGKDDAALAAANALVPMAEAEGLSVDEFVRRWLNKGAVAA